MKILFVTHQFFPLHHTGTERVTLDIAKQLQRMGNFVTVLTYEPSSILKNEKNSKFLYSGTGIEDPEFEKLNDDIKRKFYTFESVPVISFRHIKHVLGFEIFDTKIEPFLHEIIKNFDIVHFTHPMRFCSALKICKELRVPTILTLTDVWLLCPRALITSDMQICDGPDEGKKCMSLCHYDENILSRYYDAKYFFDNVDMVFSGSKFARNSYLENGWNRQINLNTFSVDYSYVKKVDDPKELVFVFMGTFAWHKGLHVLIDAFQKVKNDKIRLKIFGRAETNNPYTDTITSAAKNDNRIEFSGLFDYDDISTIMNDVSVLVIPSNYKENFPLVMQLALAFKKPVIATNTGGHPEVIQNGVNGFLFEPGNVDELSKIIQKLSDDKQLVSKIKKSIKLPPRMEQEAFTYEQTYRELLKNQNIKK